MARDDGGPAFPCEWCDEQAFRKQGRIWLCVRHYRFQCMRTQAKRHGKSVPSYEELSALVPPGLVCVGCDRRMVWTQADDRTRVITLQHDRGGGHRLICRSCNTRHAALPADEFYDVPKDHKRCPGCVRVLPLVAFAGDRGRWAGRKTYCTECSSGRHAEWVARNREHVNRKQRERRARAY